MLPPGEPTGTRPPADGLQPIIAQHVRLLEGAHRDLLRLSWALERHPPTTVDLRPSATTLSNALLCTYEAVDARRDPLQASMDALAHAKELLRQFGQLTAVEPAWVELARTIAERFELAVAQFGSIQPEARAQLPIRASDMVLRTHHVPRTLIGPIVDVAEPRAAKPPPAQSTLERPKSFEELSALFDGMRARQLPATGSDDVRAREGAPDLVTPAPPVTPVDGKVVAGFVSEGASLRLTRKQVTEIRARQCFEEVAMLGIHRLPLLGDPWRSCAVLEDRLLKVVDAIAVLGLPALGSIEQWVKDSPAKDPSRAFAAGLIGGSISGRDALAIGERVATRCGLADDDVAQQLAHGFRLAPHPQLQTVMRLWSTEPDAVFRRIAFDVMGYRGWATQEELCAACHDNDPATATLALPYLAEWFPVAARQMLLALPAPESLEGLQARFSALALSGHRNVFEEPWRQFETKQDESALIHAALGAEERDAQRLFEAVRGQPSALRAEALGWLGLPDAVPVLINWLDDSDVAMEAAFALERLTGAEMFVDTEVAPEVIDVPDVEMPADLPSDLQPSDEPLARRISDPRDQPSEGSPDVLLLPVTSRAQREQHFREYGASYAGRIRRGLPLTPALIADELELAVLVARDRRRLHRELVLRTGAWVRFDPFDLVAVQNDAIEKWKAAARSSGASSGSWSRASRS